MTRSLPCLKTCTVVVIGLGYVGLPLAVQFASQKKCVRFGHTLNRRVIGFDINRQRLDELINGTDRTNEVIMSSLSGLDSLTFTDSTELISTGDVFIVAVPTPVDSSNRPDMLALKSASITVGKLLAQRNKTFPCSLPVILYESTVYPGATEEFCIPILENYSGLKANVDFVYGYSPERINPGDTTHGLPDIIKVTSGSTIDSSDWIDAFYGSIIHAGTHKAPSIRVAEAAKVIENTQRDLNIALVNELAIICHKLSIDTLDVLEAAGTKWNFLPFNFVLVGGHCIGVDPYYLTYKAEQLGYYPQVVLAGRRINDGMPNWIVQQTILQMAHIGMNISQSKVLVMGVTFKEDCPDMRNSKVVELIAGLRQYGIEVDVFDPIVNCKDASFQLDLPIKTSMEALRKYEVVILAVAHSSFCTIDATQWLSLLAINGIVVDLKGVVPRDIAHLRL